MVALVVQVTCLAAAGGEFLALPAGVTPLDEIGVYRVGYQWYGKQPVDMPLSWSGGFTQDSGIAYKVVNHGGERALLLHCPWRNGTGSAFVEYSLSLPRGLATRLALGIAMRADVVEKSDGVTFSASVASGGDRAELMREHYTRSEPRAFEFDLARYAGKDVVLRLQTEPGPNRSPSFDFSRFVNARLIAGAGGDPRAALVKEMTSTKAYRALRAADMSAVSNRNDRGIVPSCLLEHRNSVRSVDGGYELVYDGPDCRLTYTYRARSGTLDDVTARVDDGETVRPCAGGGVTLDAPGGRAAEVAARIEGVRADGDAVRARVTYTSGGVSATVDWTFSIVGKALVIDAASRDAVIARFSLGRTVAQFRKTIPVPYLYYESAAYLPLQKCFAMGYVDWTKSHASQSPGRESVYVKRLDGKRNALLESGYVALSPALCEVLPNIPHPPSPYLQLLAPKMMLDVWGGNFVPDAKRLERYKSYGIDELAIIKHVWQRFGYDIKLPDHIPANPGMGGDEDMKVLVSTATKLGYVFSLHENYIDFYPNAPSWNEKDVVRTPSGEMSKAWYHKGTKTQSYAIKANRMLHYAAQNSPEIHRRYGTNASYLDVHTCVTPWHHVDYEAGQDRAGMHALKVEVHRKLFQYERDIHKGPLFGEGARHFYWAGLFDGAEAQVSGGEDHTVLVDFDLLKVRPQMMNHGMGYYTRWLRKGRDSKHGVDWPTPLQMDKYRAQELAYGHAGFVGGGVLDIMPLVVREYNLMQPVQTRYGTAKVTEISWEMDGRFVSSSVAAAAGGADRLRVTYDSGLRLHVNLGKSDWAVADHVLPRYGFLASAPGLTAYTAKREGVIADFAQTRSSLYADARTNVVKPWATGAKDIEPRVRSFRHLGGDRFEIAYEWRIGEELDDEYRCFVHFCDAADEIKFQNDHEVKTAAWKKGSVVSEGPYTVTIPAAVAGGEYSVLVGLYKQHRLKLRGLPAGSNRVHLGTVSVVRGAGGVTSVRHQADTAAAREFERMKVVFTDRMNVEGTMVDFGSVVTDGAFRLDLEADRLVLLPFPRDRAFQVGLALAKITMGPYRTNPRVAAVDDAGTELASVDASFAGGVVTFATGVKGATRYVVYY